MKSPGTLTVAAHGDREIVMTRVFDAPRHLVFEANTKPELLKRWLGVRGGWTLKVCEVDLKVGGAYRYVWWKESAGLEMGCGGVFREIAAPERIVCTEVFDDPWYEGECVNTTVLTEQGGATTLTVTMSFESREARDGVLRSPMERGVAESYNMLDELLKVPA
jgi:uncharacterized protein YndB with AHSA1/START domain